MINPSITDSSMTDYSMTEPSPTPILCCQRTSMSVLKMSGAHIRDYLQGQITQDIRLLTPEHPIYSAVLSPQGKMVADMYISDQGNELIMITATSHAATLIERLRRFALGHDIRLGQVEALGVLSIQGNSTDKIIHNICQAIEASIPMPEAASYGVWLIMAKEDIQIALAAMPCVCSNETMEKASIIYGTPRFTRDWDASTYPLNANLIDMKGVSFDKGCYVGQEVTSRMHWRGGIKKKLYCVQIHGNLPKTPCPIQTTIKIGTLASAATNTDGLHMGIAHLPIELIENKASLSLENGAPITVLEPCHA
ncbi:MAG: folate-binding protein [Mariprofundaceae bacterium]|nr:folate-binding protein [Mariprofundaceae bacterium]